MAVYVGPPVWPFGRMIMCHMVADTLEELHEMADAVGLRREWFQSGRWNHYDVSKGRRAKAITLGAIEISDREIVKKGIGRKGARQIKET